MNIITVGGNKKFIEFLGKISEGNTVAFNTIDDALNCAKNEICDVLFLLPFYEKGEVCIPEFSDGQIQCLSEIIANKKTKVYIENYPAYDYRDCFVVGLQARSLINNMGKYSICICGEYKERFGFEILQKRTGFYYPNGIQTDEKTVVLAEIKNCFGIHHIVHNEKCREGVALLKTSNSVYCAMVDLTNLKDNEIFPFKHWCSFFKKLLGELTGIQEEFIEETFLSLYEKPGIRLAYRSKDRSKALEEAVDKALEWHKESGIMINGGKGGVYEMIRSFDLQIAKNVRGDSSLLTAILFWTAGKYFKNKNNIKTAEDIVDNILNERQLQIMVGENKGLFKWFSDNYTMGPRSVYVSDSSRVGNAIFGLYKLSQKEEYKSRAILLGEALLKWFGGEALLPSFNFNYDIDDVKSIQSRFRCPSPEFYDAPIIFLGNLYSITNDKRYREQIIKTATHLASLYPHYETTTSHSDNFTYSRLLGVFAVAQQFGNGIWTPIINELLNYFEKLQHKSGGFFDDRAYFDEKSLFTDMEFAVGFGGYNEHIADFVYCQNTLAYVLNILLSCRMGNFNREKALKMFNKLIDFLLDTQIRSSDSRFNGAWMRAFDMDNMEYYGCDKDFAWGPYCILTGWVTGTIPLVFFDILGEKTIY